ncbi:MAG TPA: HAD-IIB family hydrolase, partial [Polyangiaceae bacterium]|nr:HAD-IIB family hydrolase [Polyangiaceae bacterium]
LSKQEAQSLSGVLFDLDDTFLEHTQLTSAAYSALFSLREVGLCPIVLTGRPASWAEMIVRMWPVAAAIAENGAVAYTLQDRVPVLLDPASGAHRAARRAQLGRLVEQVRKEVPELTPANDALGRLTDYTFDIGETQRPSAVFIQRAIDVAHRHGARTTQSSVHLHLTFDRMDKGSGAIALLTHLGYDATSVRSKFAFIGDSQNDASAFATFSATCAVANLSGQFSLLPKYKTSLPKSSGFCQFADHVVQLRSS